MDDPFGFIFLLTRPERRDEVRLSVITVQPCDMKRL